MKVYKCTNRIQKHEGTGIETTDYELTDIYTSHVIVRPVNFLRTAIRAGKVIVVNLTLTDTNSILFSAGDEYEFKIPDKSMKGKYKVLPGYMDSSGFSFKNIVCLSDADYLITSNYGDKKRKLIEHGYSICRQQSITYKLPGSNTKVQLLYILLVKASSVIVVFDCDILRLPLDSSYLFKDCVARTLKFLGVDASRVHSMRGMFRGALIDNLDISTLDTSKVVCMDDMFREFSTYKFNLDSLRVNSVKSARHMFDSCRIIGTSFDIANLKFNAKASLDGIDKNISILPRSNEYNSLYKFSFA